LDCAAIVTVAEFVMLYCCPRTNEVVNGNLTICAAVPPVKYCW